VTQVQHGALHRYFSVSPILSDRFLVWGSFWRNVLRAGKSANVEIVNPDVDVVPLDRDVTKAVKKRVTFLTTPLHLGLFWNPEATLREIAELVKRLEGRGHPVLIRIHPSDRVELWERSLRATLGSLPSSLRFSKDDPLESVLRETDVALMFFSTVFLDCLASGIPVIGLGWYPHIWQKPLGEMGAVRFADSIQEAVELVETLQGAPRQKHLAHEFLAVAPY
jgi:hypothetical protein